MRWTRSARPCAATSSSICRPGCASGQQERLARFGARVEWLSALPDEMRGVVVGNEVLDAMPVPLVRWDGTRWLERWRRRPDRRVRLGRPADRARAAARRGEPASALHARLPDRSPPAAASLRRDAGRAAALRRGVLHRLRLSRAEYYHPPAPRRTLIMPPRPPRRRRSARRPRRQDITAHVNFTAVALAAPGRGDGSARLHLAGPLPHQLRAGADAAVGQPRDAGPMRGG